MMRKSLIICAIVLLGTAACNNRKREAELDKKQVELNQKEQQLLLKEKTLQFREEEVLKREKIADSLSRHDTTAQQNGSHDSISNNQNLAGLWSVRMTCIETTCPGSAVGDTKIEQWDIGYNNRHIIAKAMEKGKLARTYSGPVSQSGTVELTEHLDTSLASDTRMIVRLRFKDNQSIEGQREIIRQNDCKIVYALQLDKQ